MIENGENLMIWKELVMAYFKVLYHIYLERLR